MKLETKIKVREIMDPIIEGSVEIGLIMACAGGANRGLENAYGIMESLGVPKAVRYAVVIPTGFVAGIGISTLSAHAKKIVHTKNQESTKELKEQLRWEKKFEGGKV